MLAELRRRNGTASQTENVVGAKGTDSELMAQLRKEAGIAPQEVVSEKENTTEEADGLFDTADTNGQEQTGTDKVAATAEEKPEVEPEKKGQTDREFKDRSAELGVSFDEFYKKFKPSLNAILAKARRSFSETLGNDIEAEWQSAADEALVKAYMKYPATGGKAELKTYASKAVVNAINSVNREHKRNFKKTGGNISLDQTNEQGEKLAEMVGDENASAIPKKENKDLIGSYNKWKETLAPKDRRILELSEDGLPPSKIGRAAKVGMTTGEVKARLKELAAAARTEGELEFSKKRKIENREIVVNTNTSQYQMPTPFNPKELKAWLKSFYKQKQEPINANTGWTISVPGTGIEETLNHLYRNRKNYRSDLHYLSLPYIDKMLENAEFEKFDEVEQGKNADAISIFNVIVDFGDQGKYNARMVIKHFGEAKNFYDHKLTKFEELSDLELQPEGSGSLNNSSVKGNIPQSGEKSSAFDWKKPLPPEVFSNLRAKAREWGWEEELEGVSPDDSLRDIYFDFTSLAFPGDLKEINRFFYEAGIRNIRMREGNFTLTPDYGKNINNYIPQSGEKSDNNLEFSKKRLHQQINPVVRDGVVRDEYADLLSVKEYTPETLEKWSKKALEWILEQGGVKPAADQLLKNHAPAEKHVATLARRMIINSDVYANAFTYEQRVELNEQEIDDRSSSRVFTENYGQLRREMITAHAVGALNKIKVYLKSHLIIPGREFILFSMQKNHINISRGKYE